MSIKKIVLLGVLGVSFMIPQLSFAEDVIEDDVQACHEQMKDLCADAGSHRDKRQCFKENRSKLSENCQEILQARKEKRKEMRIACRDDKEDFCGDARGPGQVLSCLKEHESELVQDCADKLGSFRNKGHAKKRSL